MSGKVTGGGAVKWVGHPKLLDVLYVCFHN